jgi:hypothetical protein
MRRRTFDWLLSMGGVVVVVFLIVAGTLLFVGYSYANNSVTKELTAQKISFPPADSEAITSLPAADRASMATYAGEQLTNGAQAQAYADHFIAVHLSEVAGGKTYAEVSSAALQDPNNQELQTQKAVLFQGETLRGLLLNAFAFWKLGQIAKLGAIIALVLAGVMAILTILGFWHLRRVSPEEELLTRSSRTPGGAG